MVTLDAAKKIKKKMDLEISHCSSMVRDQSGRLRRPGFNSRRVRLFFVYILSPGKIPENPRNDHGNHKKFTVNLQGKNHGKNTMEKHHGYRGELS